MAYRVCSAKLNFARGFSLLAFLTLGQVTFSAHQPAWDANDSYAVLLHSRSIEDQRKALEAILAKPANYIPHVQQDLRNYPTLLQSDPIAAKRVVYVSALLRDPSFPPILAASLGAPEVVDDCIYACPIVFALTVHSYFGGWRVPANLDSRLTTVSDLRSQIQHLSTLSLKVGSIDDVIQGPDPENRRRAFNNKTEEELITLAGPGTAANETRILAAFRLETFVSSSKHRTDLYLLALNDFEDASSEYKGAIYQAIYRAELAKSRGL